MAKVKISVQTIYSCSLERAFKTPMLSDVRKVHTGFMIMPKVTHCTEDETWGQVGGNKKVFVSKSFTQKGGYAGVDTVLERIENEYWKIQVNDFQSWILGFNRFVGEWKTIEVDKNEIQINYTYTLHGKGVLLYPFQWLFAKGFYKIYMRRVLNNIKKMIEDQEPYLYN